MFTRTESPKNCWAALSPTPGLRDKLVIASKFTFNPQEGNPNSGGNGRKNIYRALESSLRRLKMDYIDLYWMHVWDTVTPVEEVVDTLSTLVREGKIRYYGFSDVPAWYAARAQTLGPVPGHRSRSSRCNWNTRWWSAPSSANTFLQPASWAWEFVPGVRWPAAFLPANTPAKGPESSQGSRLEVLKNANNPGVQEVHRAQLENPGCSAGSCESS